MPFTMGFAAMLIPAALSFVPAQAREETVSKGQQHPSNWIWESRTVCVEGIFWVSRDGLGVVCAGDAAVALAAGGGRRVVILVAQARVCRTPQPASQRCLLAALPAALRLTDDEGLAVDDARRAGEDRLVVVRLVVPYRHGQMRPVPAGRARQVSEAAQAGEEQAYTKSRETTCPMSGPWPGAMQTWSWYMRWYTPCTSS